jgi:hypothetical protein
MKGYSPILLAAILSIVFIIVTGFMSQVFIDSALGKFSFLFHLYPFGVGFSGGNMMDVVVYYIELWLTLIIFFLGWIYLFKIIFSKHSTN